MCQRRQATSGEGCTLTATTPLGPCGEYLSKPVTHRRMQALNRSVHCTPERTITWVAAVEHPASTMISVTEWTKDLRRSDAVNSGC